MRTTTLLFAWSVITVGSSMGDNKKPEADPFTVAGSVKEDTREKDAPASGLIVSAPAFDRVTKGWGIEKPFPVDFDKQFVVVGTTRGGEIKVTTKLDAGDLKVQAMKSLDLRPGFRYVLKRVDRAGVNTVNGKPLPSE